MKILLAADGSKMTKKALAFLGTHENLAGPEDELVVVNVQAALPPRVKSMVGAATVNQYHRDEADKVLKPIEKFLERHACPARSVRRVGLPAEEILRVAKSEKVQLVVMGTHGYGPVGRALMGSVAQRDLAGSEVPVLLVK
jgi:nucleotide-binding universal stress UspA family protein